MNIDIGKLKNRLNSLKHVANKLGCSENFDEWMRRLVFKIVSQCSVNNFASTAPDSSFHPFFIVDRTQKQVGNEVRHEDGDGDGAKLEDEDYLELIPNIPMIMLPEDFSTRYLRHLLTHFANSQKQVSDNLNLNGPQSTSNCLVFINESSWLTSTQVSINIYNIEYPEIMLNDMNIKKQFNQTPLNLINVHDHLVYRNNFSLISNYLRELMSIATEMDVFYFDIHVSVDISAEHKKTLLDTLSKIFHKFHGGYAF